MSPNEKFQRAVEALLYIASRTHENIPGFEDARKMSTMEAWWHAYMVIRTHAQNTLREIELLPIENTSEVELNKSLDKVYKDGYNHGYAVGVEQGILSGAPTPDDEEGFTQPKGTRNPK